LFEALADDALAAGLDDAGAGEQAVTLARTVLAVRRAT
jgi:hypothetical protein